MPSQPPKTVIISGGTDGMGRATALDRLSRGDRVTVIGSNAAKGRSLLDRAATPDLHFVQADLSSVAEVERVVADLTATYETVDALALFANRISPRRQETPEGLEYTFALYHLSRHLLGHRLLPLLGAAPAPVVVNVAGVGNTADRIHWDDPQLTSGYSQMRAQLQAGRPNDLLGVDFAGRAAAEGHPVRYVLYHPGFTRSGADNMENALFRGATKVLGRLLARPVDDAVRPVSAWIDRPPTVPLTAVDRDKRVDLPLKTLNPTTRPAWRRTPKGS